MKTKSIFLLVVYIIVSQLTYGQRKNNSSQLKPRIVILTDVSTWETDDSESLVRLFVYADMFEIEGLIYTTGWSLSETRDDFFELIHKAINAYEKDLPNLMKRSGQKGHSVDESVQIIGYWPSANYLKERTVYGSRKRGMEYIGEDNDSPGSELIISLADEEDERPLWICIWGGGNTLAQSVWRVQRERDSERLNAFLNKIPTYAITDQDREQRTPFNLSSQQWLRREFEKHLLYLWDESAWLYQNGTGKNNWEEYEKHIQGHGNLGNVYPKYKYGVEGDTPSFLYVMPNGLNDPLSPTQASWGGCFRWSIGPDNETYAYNNHQGEAKETSRKYESYFYPAIFNDFAARMDWAKNGEGNRNPVIVINGQSGTDIIKISPKVEEEILLDASKSFDPDKDQITFNWWIQSEAGTFSDKIIIMDANSRKAKIKIPENAAGESIHVICEITDMGTPNLTSYRRIVIEPLK